MTITVEHGLSDDGPDRCQAAIERMTDRGENYTIRPVDHMPGVPNDGWVATQPLKSMPVDDSHLFAAGEWPGVLDYGDSWDPPVFKAARNRNPAILRAIISRGYMDLLKQEAIYDEYHQTLYNQARHRPRCLKDSRGISYHPDFELYETELGGWEGTPLLQAVECQLEDNVRTLLDVEVDPNGVSLRPLSQYAAEWNRSGLPQADEGGLIIVAEPSDKEMVQVGQAFKLHALTEDEIRTRTGLHVIESFWFGFQFKWTLWSGRHHHRPPTTSLIEAARGGSLAIFDLLHQSGADATAWLRSSSFDGSEVPHKHSALAPSTPLHAAIESDHLDMLQHLLMLGFNPDSLPLSIIDRAISPIMSATMRDKVDFYDALVAHGANLHLKTPVMHVHHLHFAAGNLSLLMLRRIVDDIPLSAAGVTALGHTLLHVACLPFDKTYICIYSPKVYASIHDIRPHLGIEVYPPDNRNAHPVGPEVPVFQEPQDCGSFQKQTETVQYLLQNDSSAVVSAKDIYENTPLHYLAGYRTVNEGLVSILRRQEGGEDVWACAKNRWGHTPRDLWEDGRNCVEEHFKDFWDPEPWPLGWAEELYPGSITFEYRSKD